MMASANLVTVEPTPTRTHQFRFPLELAVRRLQFLLDTTTPAPFLTTVLSRVGVVIATANLVTVEPTPTKTHLFWFPLERLQIPELLHSQNVILTAMER
jgi:hypothetical protein